MKHLSFLLAAGAALLVAGCDGTQNRGLESVHQPVVDRSDYALDLGTRGGRLAYGEEARLAGWLDGMRVGYGDRVAVDDPVGANGGARADIGRVLAGYGLLMQADAPVTASPVAPGAERVVVSRSHAAVPGCPDYSRDSSWDVESNTSSNYGCAVNANLASMIAAPADLVHGRDGAATTDPRQSGKAINAYRGAAPGGAGGTSIKAEKAGAN